MVDNTAKWGRKTARERYGKPESGGMKAPDREAPQKLGDANNLRGPDLPNDHSNDWVRAKGESAEGKPGFDK